MSQFAKGERSQPEMNNPNHDSRDTRLSADCRARLRKRRTARRMIFVND